MPEPTYAELLDRAAVYEHALIRIADKPREYRELVTHEGGKPRGVLPGDAYRKCGNIAWAALSCFSPTLKREDLKRLDLEIREENGWLPKATKRRPTRQAARKARAKRAKGGG